MSFWLLLCTNIVLSMLSREKGNFASFTIDCLWNVFAPISETTALHSPEFYMGSSLAQSLGGGGHGGTEMFGL